MSTNGAAAASAYSTTLLRVRKLVEEATCNLSLGEGNDIVYYVNLYKMADENWASTSVSKMF